MSASKITHLINADCSSPPPCSICLDLVTDDGERSVAKLHCGHKFHLDCIGSAFNTKGAMQCPNCRRVESGRWLFADGSARAISETGAREWLLPYEGSLDWSYSRQPIGFYWRPFRGFMVHSSTEETESSLNTFDNFQGNYAMITEHTAVPSSGHSYISYFQPIEHVGDSSFHHPLNSYPAPRRSTYIQHSRWGWNCHFPPYYADRYFIDQSSTRGVGTATRRSTHAQAQPIYHTQQLVSRTRESPAANSQLRERNRIHHTTYHHHEQPSEVINMPSSTNGFRRSGGALALPIILPAISSQPQR